MVSWRLVAMEVSAAGAATLSIPLRFLLRSAHFDPTAHCVRPIVLVHGFFGDPTNFLVLRGRLAASGMPNFATFSYAPRIDYQRLAHRLGQSIQTFCQDTGVPEVDVIGHSLGGLIARYLVEMDAHAPVRRLATLGAPYFASPLPANELAIFGSHDPFIPPPHPRHWPHAWGRTAPGRVVVVPDCGHWGLLYHPMVRAEVTDFLHEVDGQRIRTTRPLALEAAS